MSPDLTETCLNFTEEFITGVKTKYVLEILQITLFYAMVDTSQVI